MPIGLPPMNDDDIEGGEFTEKERKAVRKIVRDQARMDWLWGTLRIWAGWVSGGIVGAYAIYEIFLRFFKKAAGS